MADRLAILLLLVLSVLCGPLAAAEIPTRLSRVTVAGGFLFPVAVRHAGDGSGRLFVVEQNGLIRLIAPDGSVSTFLDLSSTGLGRTARSGERGLLGLAFHPDYPTVNQIFVNYTSLGSSFDTVIERFAASGDPDLADAASGTVILTVDQDFANHNGGDIHFGPDGYLYIGMGDGGSGGDPNDRAQDMTTLLGKMLRIDIDNPGQNAAGACNGATNYGIPADNPFIGSGDEQCDEIWASGLRNPYRFSFDRLTGDLWIADVGQNTWEEVNLQPQASAGGENYGWDCREGAHDFLASPADSCALNPLTVDPVMEYNQAGSPCSVTGGFRFRGPTKNFLGGYFFADYCTGEVFLGTSPDEVTWSFSLIDDALTNVSGFGESEDGRLFTVGYSNGLITEIDLLFYSGQESD